MTAIINPNGSNTLRPSGRTEAQDACVELLTEALEMAMAGKVETCGIILCLKDGYASVMAGARAADLNMGLDVLKGKILGALEDDGNRRKAKVSWRGGRGPQYPP